MYIWHLTRHEDTGWDYDEVISWVIIASSEDQARALAAEGPGDEGARFWLEPSLSICKLIGTALYGEPSGIVVRSFHAG